MGVHCVQLFFSCTITKQPVTWLSPAEHTVNACFWNADRSQFGNARKGEMAGGSTGTNDTWGARLGWCQVYLPSVETSTQFGLYLLHSSIISTSTALLWSPFPGNCWKSLIKLCIDLAHCHSFPKLEQHHHLRALFYKPGQNPVKANKCYLIGSYTDIKKMLFSKMLITTH